MLALAAAVMVVTGAGELRPETWVVVSQRSSVAKGPALEVARALTTALTDAGVPTTAADDLTQCAAKIPCVVKAAREKGVSVVVTLEIGSALGDLLVRAAAISVEEDGRVLQRAEVEGSPETIGGVMKEKVVALFAPTVRTLLALPDPNAKPAPSPEPAPKPEPEPPKVAEAPKPAPAPAVTEPAGGGGMPTAKIAGIAVGAVGAVTLISGIGVSAKSAGLLGERDTLCPRDKQCNDPKAYEVDSSFRSTQTAGAVLLVAGLVVAAAGVVMFFALGRGPGEEPGSAEPGGPNPGITLAPVLAPGFSGLALSGSF